jgi:tRNA pseudouridine13 synthase
MTRLDPKPHALGPEPAFYLTSDIPGTGGRIKQRPEDFLVEELPAYEPCGDGEHLYLFIEKRDLSTMNLVEALSRHYGVRRDAVGYAGLKDKAAVTRQLVSVHLPGKKDADLRPFEHTRAAVLWAARHTNKLRQGHLSGNRFIIRIREVEPARVVQASRVLQRLAAEGVPNLAGEQRFGHLANNHIIGRAILLGDYQTILKELLGPSERFPGAQPDARRFYAEGRYQEAYEAFTRNAETERRVLRALVRGDTPRRAAYAIDQMQRRFFITAFQSSVFNTVLRTRLEAGTLATLVEGDLAWKHDNGSVFRVDAPVASDAATRERLARLEISPSGPMWGPDMTQAQGATGEAERAALDATGVTLETIKSYGERAHDPVPGKRRPLRVPLALPDVEGGADEHGPYIRCAFELPSGSFATVVLNEIIKPGAPDTLPEDPSSTHG